MTLLRNLSFLVLAALGAATLVAQGAWSPAFDQPGFGTGGRVFALGTWRNELIAGTYQTPKRDGATLNHVARFDGVHWQPIGGGVNGQVRTAISFQGDLCVGGQFGLAGTTPALCVARWDGSQWSAFGAGLSGQVWALCEHQGSLYAAGEFVVSGSQQVRGLARWTGTQWVEVGGGVHRTLFTSAVPQVLFSDGNLLYIGGEFDRAGTTVVGHIAAWDGAQWHTLAGGVSGYRVSAIARHNGLLYCGGSFSHAGGVPAPDLAAWNGSQWVAVGSPLTSLFYTPEVRALCVYNNELHVGGHFNGDGASTMYNVARFDGSQLQPVGGVGQAEFNPSTVFAMAAWNGRLYCGGEFQIAGEPAIPDLTRAVYHIASYDGADWSAVGGGFGFDNEVRALGRYQGQAIAGGRFSLAGGSRAFHLGRFDGDEWRWFGTFENGSVLDMCEHNGELWVAGDFATIDGVTADGVARFDGTLWHDVGGGPGPFRADCIESFQGVVHIGTLGGVRAWNGAAWLSISPGLSGQITDLHVYQGLLYIGAATVGTQQLHAWDGANLTVPGGGVNGSVDVFLTFGTELIVGGRFSTAGGIAAERIARWNGSSWAPIGNGFHGAGVFSLAEFRGSLIAGGGFDTLLGDPDNTLARWNGSSWTAFAPTTPNGAIFALLPDDARGELLVGGNFNHIASSDAAGLAAWQEVPFWSDVGQALGTPRRTPFLTGDGSLLPGSRTRWRLSSAEESSFAIVAMGLGTIYQPLLGGTLVPTPDVLALRITDGIGTASIELTWPGPLPGFQAWLQAWVLDPAGTFGFAASNAVSLTAP